MCMTFPYVCIYVHGNLPSTWNFTYLTTVPRCKECTPNLPTEGHLVYSSRYAYIAWWAVGDTYLEGREPLVYISGMRMLFPVIPCNAFSCSSCLLWYVILCYESRGFCTKLAKLCKAQTRWNVLLALKLLLCTCQLNTNHSMYVVLVCHAYNVSACPVGVAQPHAIHVIQNAMCIAHKTVTLLHACTAGQYTMDSDSCRSMTLTPSENWQWCFLNCCTTCRWLVSSVGLAVSLVISSIHVTCHFHILRSQVIGRQEWEGSWVCCNYRIGSCVPFVYCLRVVCI